MPAVLIRHRVNETAAAARALERDSEARAAYGSHGYSVFLNTADPHDIMILLAWDDRERAQFYARSDDLRRVLAEAGISGVPDVWIVDTGN